MTTFPDLIVIADKLMQENPQTLQAWDVRTLAIWFREGCRCAYCGRDMLQDREHMYNWQCLDHVLPVAKYERFEHYLGNRALACAPCNFLKLAWDPNKESPGDGQLIPDDADSISESQLSELIERTRRHLALHREQLNQSFRAEKDLMLATMPKLLRPAAGKGAAAGG